METLTVLGAVTQIIDLARTISDVLHYINSVIDAPEEIQRTRDEIASHLTLLESVRRLIERYEYDDALFSPLLLQGGPLEASMNALRELEAIVCGDPPDQNPRDRFRAILSRLRDLSLDGITWPARQRKINEIRERLQRQKSSISVGLTVALTAITTVGTTACMGQIQEVLEDVKLVNERLSEAERKAILNRCLPSNGDISTIHKNRMAQQEAGTCEWVSREEHFTNWLRPHNTSSNPSRFICIYGIPGAGKTVLASSLIQTAARNCQSRGYAYYYCLYSRKQDETVPFLMWVLRQLCKQQHDTVPTKVKEADASEDGLSIPDLLDCLYQVSLTYENGVYIIVDAVDESKPRENLRKVLTEIGTDERFWKVSLLFTSREEDEIMRPIRELGSSCVCISMSNINVREDIKRYVHTQLTRADFFVRWEDPAFLEDVENTLTHKAKGMFRWAVCQLDVLKRKRDRESIRKALETLPEDIFATYQRILVEIPEMDREFSRAALALICSHTAKIPTAEVLVTACLYSVPFNDIMRFSVDTLKEICGSLISLSDLNRAPMTWFNRDNEGLRQFHRCSLAHYTVKEYLFSPIAASGPANFFALSDQIVRDIDLKVSFTGLSHFGVYTTHQSRPTRPTVSRYEEYCLETTEHALIKRRPDIMSNEDIRKIVISSLTPTSPHFVHLRNVNGISRIMKVNFPTWNSISVWDPSRPVTPALGLLVNLVILEWPELANKYLGAPEFDSLRRTEKAKIWTERFRRDEESETILGYCLRKRDLTFLSVLVNHGASFEHEPEALYTTMRSFKNRDMALKALELLLNHGATTNPIPNNRGGAEGGFAFTPLQLAVYLLEYEWIELLLDENADVNMTGTPGGIVPSSWNETRAAEEIDQQPVLEICSFAEPSWIHVRGTNSSRIRDSISELLRRHGAEELIEEEDEDIEVGDVSEQNINEHQGDVSMAMMSDDTDDYIR
ncbi:hypothetical protein O1611_g3085 [Lasiodiplodia mahajangana]|uniref:Uncharacterized protein n=1 Tax=Lasiodiplodia mahajangana TaxID=1108764 RepID=A0ACC2JT14_9PEZI|nr:hypothetical protein O1611_g3085 [Lasiodiplodia mahajangana]